MVDYSEHGVFLRQELARELGEHGVRVALRNGTLAQPWRGILVIKDRALTLPTRAAAALLAVGNGAALSDRTAAELHGCGAAACQQVHVTVPYNCRTDSRRGVIVHKDRFDERDVVLRLGLRVLKLDFVVAELLCTARRPDALACADQALAGLSPEDFRDFVAAVRRRLTVRDDRRGTLRADMLLNLATGKADSPPESWLRLLVVDAGFPVPTPQFEIRDLGGRLLYRLDMAWPELRIALEYDGYEAHEDREIQDAEREERLRSRGWIVIRVRAADLSDPGRLFNELRDAFRVRGGVAWLREDGT